MIWLLIVVTSLLAASYRLSYKIAIRTNDEVLCVAGAQLIGAVIASPLLYFCFPTESIPWHLLIAQALLWVSFVYFDIRSLRYLDLGLSAILGSVEYVAQICISALFFGEHLTGPKLFGAALILTGISIASEWTKPQFRRGVSYQLLSVVCIMLVLPIDAVLARQLNPWFVAASAYLGPATLLAVSQFRSRKRLSQLAFIPGPVMYAGLMNAGCYLLTLYLFTQLNYADTVSSYQLTVAFSLLLGWIVLKERDSGKKRLLAMILVGFGVWAFLRT